MATHLITFNYNASGGSGAPASGTWTCQTATYPRTFTATISSTKPSKQYYNFLGWSLTANSSSASNSSGQTLSFTFTSSSQGDVVRNWYAVWQRAKVTVSYNANGGSSAPSSQTVDMYEWFTLRAGVPTRAGYNFLGWNTNSSATTAQYQPSGSARFTSNVTLYAVWEQAASFLTVSNGTMGTSMTISISRSENSYTDTITYQFGSVSGTIVTKTSNNTVTWTPPTTLANQIPNASSGSLVFTCTTYNGNTAIGTSTKTVTLSVPNSLAPTASVTISDTVATCISWGVYVQSRSKLAFSVSASGQESATISSYRTTVNGTQYTTDTFTTDVLLASGTNSYTVLVTDSRGKQTTVTGTFPVTAYAVPAVTLVSCDRNDSDANQIDISFDYVVSSVSSNNAKQYAVDYKLKTAINWTSGTVITLPNYSGTISTNIPSLDQGDEWDIRVRVLDSFGAAETLSEVGVSGNILLNSRHRGGLGLLMKSQADNRLDVGKNMVLHGSALMQFGSTVQTHSTSGTYAKVLTFGTNVSVGKNLAPVNSWNTGRRWWGSNINSSGLLGQVLETLPVGTYTISWKYTLTAIPIDTTTEFKVGKYVRVYYGGSYHILSGYSLTTIPTYSIGDSYDIQATITIDSAAVGQSFEVLGYCGQSDSFYATLTEYQIEIGSEKTPFEPYVDTNDINVNAPITLEYVKTGDVSPTTLTIVFNRDYSLNSFTKDASADAYLHNLATATWNLYIGKASSSDSVEILDFHNPWSNTDMTLDWDDTAVSTLPTGYISASKINGMMQCGVKTGSTVATHSYGDFTVTFPTPFPSIPTVCVSLYTSSTGYGMGSVSAVVCVGTVSTTGFTIRCYNNDSEGRNPAYTWIAIL